MDRKKQRGQRRKLKAMFKYMDQFVPFSETDQAYEHFHVPGDLFIESNRTSGRIKTQFCRKWLKTTEEIVARKPADIPFCRVVAVLAVPCYWSSQIIIFYDESYFQVFWKRTGPEQFWIPIRQGKSFCESRNIVTALSEICCHEKMISGDDIVETDLWFYGDVPALE